MPSDSDHERRFSGFERPEQNWFRMPSNWTDITAGITSLAELKIVEYVLKHTWGYQEYEITKKITIDEFMNGRRRKDGTRLDLGTGLSKPSVVAGIKSAVANGYLIEETENTDKARIRKYYRLRMARENQSSTSRPTTRVETEESLEETEGVDEGLRSFTPGVKNLNIGVNMLNSSGKDSLHRSETDNIERKQQTDTKSTNITSRAENDHVVVALLDQGISRPVARRLAQNFSEDYIAQKQDYLEFLLAKRPHEVKKPAAWLRRAIEDDYSAPDGFISQEDRQRQAEDEKSRNQAFLEAQEQERERRAADEKAREKKLAAIREKLRAQYGTTSEDITFWETARKDLSFNTTGGVHALVANAEILRVTEDRVILGIPHQFQFQQLQHPGYQAALKRIFKQLARRPLGLELVLLAETESEN